MDTPCFYNPNNGRHSSVAIVTSGKAIFTVAGEIFLGRKFAQVIANEIEWTHQGVENANNNNDEKKSPRKIQKIGF